jgi:hypothetical protein
MALTHFASAIGPPTQLPNPVDKFVGECSAMAVRRVISLGLNDID